MRKLIFIFILLTVSAFVFSQNSNENNEALKVLLSLNKQEPENFNIKYLIGTNYFYSNNYKESIVWLSGCLNNLGKQNELKKNNKLAPIETYFILGKSYFYNYQFDSAIKMFEKFQAEIKNDLDKKPELDKFTSSAVNAKKMTEKPIDIKKENVLNINSKYDDFKPLLNSNEDLIIFTRKVNNNYIVFYSTKNNNIWDKPKQISSFNPKDNFIASYLSIDGDMLLLNKYEGKKWQIYTSQYENNLWTIPKKLMDNINNSNNNLDATTTPDKNKIYFSSDRAGGYGGFDIYYSIRLPNGHWGEIINVGKEINSENNETSPLVFQDNSILYFSSDGYNSMGGTDIFKAELDDDGFFKNVENLDYPINTVFNDQLGYVSVDNSILYYSTYNDNYTKDIFKVEFNKNKKKKLAVIESYIKNKNDDSKVKDIIFDVYQKDNNKYIGTYKSNPITGKVTLILESNKQYTLKSKTDKYKFVNNNFNVSKNTKYYDIHKSIKLDSIGTVK